MTTFVIPTSLAWVVGTLLALGALLFATLLAFFVAYLYFDISEKRAERRYWAKHERAIGGGGG